MGRKKKIKALRKNQREIRTQVHTTANEVHRRIGEMSPFDLGVELSRMGICTTGQEGFKKLIPNGYTADAEPIIAQWCKELRRDPSLEEVVFMQVAAMKLWMTWCPDRPCDMFLEMSYEEGYESWDLSDDESALEHWTRFMILLDRRWKSSPSIDIEIAKIDQLLGEDWDIWFEDYRMLINEMLPEERVLKIEIKLAELEKPIEELAVREIQELKSKISAPPHGMKH